MRNIFDNEQAAWNSPQRCALGVFSAMRGPMAEAHTFCFSKSSSSSSPSQITGGTQSGSAGQANGTRNNVNTGTSTTVNSTSRNSGNETTTVGNNSVVTFNGLDAEAVTTLLTGIGNAISGSTSSPLGGANGTGGVTITTTPPVSTVQTTAWSDVVKKYALWFGLGVLALGYWIFRSKKS